MAEPQTTGLHVAAGERGLLRVFALTLTEAEAQALDAPGALQRLIGAETFDADQADLFQVADLAGMSLSDYLAEAHDVPADELAPLRARLDALEEHVLIVRSQAFGGKAMTLLPSRELRLVAVLGEPATDWRGGPLDSDSARPFSAPRTPPREARIRARRIGGMVFAGFMILLALVLWGILS